MPGQVSALTHIRIIEELLAAALAAVLAARLQSSPQSSPRRGMSRGLGRRPSATPPKQVEESTWITDLRGTAAQRAADEEIPEAARIAVLTTRVLSIDTDELVRNSADRREHAGEPSSDDHIAVHLGTALD